MHLIAALFVLIQVVSPVWTDAPPAMPKGTKMAILEGSPKEPGLFTLRLKVPTGSGLPLHTHPRAERVTILSGKVTVTIDGKATTFESGGFYVTPANVPHTVAFDEESVVQLTCEGPWVVELVK